MDPVAFDTLARAIAQPGTRRRLLGRLLVGVPLLGALAPGGEAALAAERPLERLQRRTPQRNRQQRNNRRSNTNKKNDNNQNNNNQNNNDGGGSGGGGQLGAVLPGQPGPLSNCLGNCQEAFDGCAEPCNNSVCLEVCQDRLDSCKANCPPA